MVVALTMSGLFPSTIERALTLARNHEWAGAAAALDQAAAEDPALFAANNFHYLRGRLAENQYDWTRARQEFQAIPPGNPLGVLAVWHTAIAAARAQDDAATGLLYAQLPADFPADFKMQLARISSTDLALKIYRSLASREARLEHARITDDKPALWSLIRERKDDDAGLQAARLAAPAASTAKEMIEVADTYLAHRQFEYAYPLYQAAAKDPVFAADSRYQIARIQFLREDFRSALETYRSIAKDFPDTDWQRDSDYQVANGYWRLGEYKSAEQAYLDYLSKYGSRGMEDAAIRNLVDVYRVLGDNTKAIAWIDKALAGKRPPASRQMFIFTKAKVLYTQKRYTAAALLFRQLGRAAVRSTPGGTTREEARFFEALSLSKSGNAAAAKTIWRDLASDTRSYYGVKSAEKLGERNAAGATDICGAGTDTVLQTAMADLGAMRRPLKSVMDPPVAGAFSELLFLELWDEASIWSEGRGERPGYRTAAELAYAAGRFHRAIANADRLPKSDSATLGLLYPAGFRRLVCNEASKNNVDPLWLHAIIWQESKYNPNARSGASARGLMQFIPETANVVGASIGMPEFTLDRLYDPGVSIAMGAKYWASLIGELQSEVLALAAYNGGIDNVRRWKNKWPDGDDDFFVADIGFVETKKYVMAVYGAYAGYRSRQ